MTDYTNRDEQFIELNDGIGVNEPVVLGLDTAPFRQKVIIALYFNCTDETTALLQTLTWLNVGREVADGFVGCGIEEFICDGDEPF